jgi:hypothetical protein
MLRFVSFACLAGCVAPAESTAEAPLVGVDGSVDQADRACNVILRSLDRGATSWTGALEISAAAAAEGLVPTAIYQADSDPIWYQAAVAPSQEQATFGFARYDLEIDHALPHGQLQVAPYAAMPEGGRLFDHNRNPGDFANYLVAAPDFAIAPAPTVCPAIGATLVFAADWTEQRMGALVAGGEATIAYDVARLSTCRGEPWDITANVRFAPGGGFDGGFATTIRGGSASFAVPPGTQQVVIWFENTGPGCQAWDSNYGANYTFDVAQ